MPLSVGAEQQVALPILEEGLIQPEGLDLQLEPQAGIASSMVTQQSSEEFPVADSFIYPMTVWQTVTKHGDLFAPGVYHMGVDLGGEIGIGAPVYAIADGIVREVRVRSKFGLVVLIEHELPNGNRIVSLSGHLRPTDAPVSEGDVVRMGDRIGSLGDASENGGWAPHLHFGIHKDPYSSTWIYYGHVRDQSLTDTWYTPKTFIEKRLTEDSWNPSITLQIGDGSFISNYISTAVQAVDIGGGIDTVEVELSDDNTATWEPLASFTREDSYPYNVSASASGIDDGRVYMRITATDRFDNSTTSTIRLQKDPSAFTTRHTAAIKGQGSSGLTHLLYQSGGVDRSVLPFTTRWKRSGDIAVGDTTGDGELEMIVVKGARYPKVKVLAQNGTEISEFRAFNYNTQFGARVAAGDIDGDDIDEIIVGYGRGSMDKLRIFEPDGTLISEIQPFAKQHMKGKKHIGIDVAAGDIDGDGVDEVIAGLRKGAKSKIAMLEADGTRTNVVRAFGRKYKDGINIGTGDVDGDGQHEIIVGTNGGRKAMVRVIESGGKKKRIQFFPFGDSEVPVDVASTDWDGDGTDELLMSQARDGEAWLKTYRFNQERTVLTAERVFEAGFEGGVRISGWK